MNPVGARVSGAMITSPGVVTRRRSSIAEFVTIVLGHVGLSVILTYPLALQLTTVSYKIHAVGDAQYSVWNVAWVAHALLNDARQVLEANIFYPEHRTLIFSEPNLLAGALGMPVYWWTGGNPYATLNAVVVLSFVLSGTATYYLVRYLVHDRRAAFVSAICFAYCPYVFSRFAHVQLLLTAPMPLMLLAFHRLADHPTLKRGGVLGLAFGIQALACGYYAVFLATLIGPLVVLTAVIQGLVKNVRFWAGLAVAGLTSAVIVVPLFAQYLALQQRTGFGRSIEDAHLFSASWRTYLVSGAYASSWLADGTMSSAVLFPGFVAAIFGLVGFLIAWRLGGRSRQLAAIYGGVAVLAFWLSLGPAGHLYTIAYRFNPAFTLMRAPNRFGVLVSLAFSVAASFAIAPLLRRVAMPALIASVLCVIAAAEHVSPLRFTPVPTIAPAYRLLAAQPAGAVLELPLFSRRHGFARTRYMLNSTAHWKPLVNGYSDYIPSTFSDELPLLADFPTEASFDTLPAGVRYAVFHLDGYKGRLRETLTAQVQEFANRLRLLYADEEIWLYEIIEPAAPLIAIGP